MLPPPFVLPRVRAMPRRFHTREYSRAKRIDTALESATVLSGDASRVLMACLRGSAAGDDGL